MAIKKKQTELIWANEVMEVYQNRGTEVYDCVWSTPSAKSLMTWTREEAKNEEKFLTAMVPKATDILSKSTVEDVTDAVLAIDTKTIMDLKLLLNDALKDCSTTEQKKVQALPVEVAKLEPEPKSKSPTLEDLLS
jgi:hypothetical protein